MMLSGAVGAVSLKIKTILKNAVILYVAGMITAGMMDVLNQMTPQDVRTTQKTVSEKCSLKFWKM